MSAAGKLDILINQGSTFPLSFQIIENGATVDLTGYVFRGKIKASFSATAALASFTFTVRTQTGANLGWVDGIISATDTAAIPITVPTGTKRTLTKYVYDIESVDLAGIVKRRLEGTASISPEITT